MYLVFIHLSILYNGKYLTWWSSRTCIFFHPGLLTFLSDLHVSTSCFPMTLINDHNIKQKISKEIWLFCLSAMLFINQSNWDYERLTQILYYLLLYSTFRCKMIKSNGTTNNSILNEHHLSSKRTHQYMFNTFISLLVRISSMFLLILLKIVEKEIAYLWIYIFIQILGFIHLPLNTYSLVISNSSWTIPYYRRIYMLTANIILIGLYGFGLIVLDQHSRTGLLVV